jgi:hypothetical protein
MRLSAAALWLNQMKGRKETHTMRLYEMESGEREEGDACNASLRDGIGWEGMKETHAMRLYEMESGGKG